MDKKTKLPLISSTPHIKHTAKLNCVFENEAISPIVFNSDQVKGADKQLKKTKESRPKPVKIVKENEVVTKKKKCLPTKKKDTASTAALKEMGLNIKAPSTNALSCSRQNLYNCYPEPIIVDSDEEMDIQVIKTNCLLEKKSIAAQPTKSLTRRENDCKRRLTKNLRESKADTKKNPTIINNVHQTPQPSCSRSRIAKKRPLRNLANITSPNREVCEGKDKQALIKGSKNPSVINLESEDSIFCEDSLPVNFSSVKRKKYLKFSSVEDVVGKDTIKWTPRSRRGKEYAVINKKMSDSELESSDTDDCNALKTLIVNGQFNNPIAKENVDKRTMTNLRSEAVEHDSNLPKELLYRFADVVFKPSEKHKGCVIASSLASGTLDFGYLELDGDKTFIGKRPNVTYVLLEGSVKALFQGKTQNLTHGDILHIHENSGYQLHNLQSSHARFLYIKEKQSPE